MALPRWVRGALRPSPLITWFREGTNEEEDLTGSTMTGLIKRKHSSEDAVPIAGALTPVSGGTFRWNLELADVMAMGGAGDYEVQFEAVFSSGPSPAKTFVTDWTVERSL